MSMLITKANSKCGDRKLNVGIHTYTNTNIDRCSTCRHKQRDTFEMTFIIDRRVCMGKSIRHCRKLENNDNIAHS